MTAPASEPLDDLVQHLLGQPAGEGVLLADVVAAQDRLAGGRLDLDALADFELSGDAVSLDQALSLMRRGRTSEARDLALEAAETFRTLEVERETLSAMLFLRESFVLGVAKTTLLEDVIDYLRRAEHDPEARFNPRPL